MIAKIKSFVHSLMTKLSKDLNKERIFEDWKTGLKKQCMVYWPSKSMYAFFLNSSCHLRIFIYGLFQPDMGLFYWCLSLDPMLCARAHLQIDQKGSNMTPGQFCRAFETTSLAGIYRRLIFKIRPNILIGLQKLRLRPKDRSRLFIYWNFLRRFSFVYPTSTIQQNSKQP